MNGSNPFQIPPCFQLDAQRRNRERFKKGVMAVIVAAVLLLIGLLIQGCKSERASSATAHRAIPAPRKTVAVTSQQTSKSISPGPQVPPTRPCPTVTPQSTPAVSKTSTMQSAGHSVTVYVVRSGDTLSQIAKAHGVTVKALKSANHLSSDLIVVGAKLRIPSA